jgi:hypothetical protein
MSIRAILAEFIPTWLKPKRNAGDTGKPTGGSQPAGGAGNGSGTTGP